nr:retrovirus-related Pol polyprotein from transposon TNT 1-94 [Tanacetum cinerariifolium]
MWEEITQSIHSFVEDKNNLALHTHGKKKANPIVIPSIRFTKLIIHHLQSKHKFYPRPDSHLHLPYEEYILGYLKFSAKGTKREEYLEKVAKHQRYLAGEEDSDPDSPAPKPAKATKKSKPSAPKAAPVIKPAAAQQPKPKSAPAKTQEKKRKLVTETSDKLSLAKSSKPSLMTKRCKPTGSLSLVDEFVDEGILEKEPRFDDEEADMQRAVEESLKSVYDVHRGPLPPVVFREPDSGKFQPLPETPKKVNPAEQYIFQRRTPAPTKPSSHAESPSIYAKLGLTDRDTESDEEVSPVVRIRAQDKGQARPNPGVQIEGQVGSNPGDDAEPQPQSSLVVHAGPKLKHMDLEATDVSTQQNPKQIDEGFTATAYLNLQENLKLTVEEHVILEEPASSTGTLSSLQHLAKDFSFGDQFFNDKPSEAENEKTTAETEAESMVSVIIQQDTFAILPMKTPVIDLTSRPDSPNVHRPLQASAIQAPLRNRFRDLPEADMKEILHQRMWETNSYKDHEDHMMLNEALEKSMNRDHTEELLTDLDKAQRKKKKRHDSPKTPPGSPPHQPPPPLPQAGPSGTLGSPRASGSSQFPPPPPPLSTSQSDQSKSTAASSSSKTATLAEYTAWITTDTRLRPSVSSIPKDLHMDQDWWKPLEEDRPATPEPAWSISSSDLPVPMNNWASILASTYTPPPENSLLAYNVSKPLQLGSPPSQVTIQSDFFFNKDLEYLRYGSKGGRPALSISKMKAAYYPDAGLDEDGNPARANIKQAPGSDKCSLDELVYGAPSKCPCQTNLPSRNDIISYIREDREGQVTRIYHQEEVEVQDYQILTREIVSTLKPLEEIIWENVFCLGGQKEWSGLLSKLERKPKKDRGMTRGRHSTSSSTFNQQSSSHLNDDDNDDGNNEGTSRVITPSPIRTPREVTKAVEYLKKEFEMKDLGKTKFCLGLQIEHLVGFVLIFRYLHCTKDMGLYYTNPSQRNLVGFPDAGCMFDPHTGWSQTGYVFTSSNNAISWRFVKQTMSVTSSNHAEILAIHEAN